MSDVYQSQSPLVTDPTVLTEDATKATSNEDLLRILNNQTTKRRGRPPGSRNKPKMGESGQLIGGPMPRQHATSNEDMQKAREKRVQDKKARARKLETQILKEANEAIMELLMSFGVPGELLYEPGHVPQQKRTGNHYTILGNKIAIGGMEAKILALTLAEMESSDIGSKVSSKIAEDSPIRMAFLGIASVLMVGSHVKGILELRKEFEPYLMAWKQAKEENERIQKEQEQNAGATDPATVR